MASHFLTPEGRLIHSVTGPVPARVLLHEAKWAIDMYGKAKSKSRREQLAHVSAAHAQASLLPLSRQDQQVHQLLTQNPLPHLQTVYGEIFENILGQRVSQAGPRLVQAAGRLEFARRSGRPLLFVLHDGKAWSNPTFDTMTHQLIHEYVVIVMPLREAPALSQLTDQPPFQASGSARPLFVVARSDCQQLRSVSGWKQRELTVALADGWVDALERNPPSIGKLVRAQRLLRKADPAAADRVRDLTIRVREAREAERDESNRLAAR